MWPLDPKEGAVLTHGESFGSCAGLAAAVSDTNFTGDSKLDWLVAPRSTMLQAPGERAGRL